MHDTPIQRAAMAAAEECYRHFRVDVDMECGIDEEKARAAAIFARHYARFEGVAEALEELDQLCELRVKSGCGYDSEVHEIVRTALKLLREEGGVSKKPKPRKRPMWAVTVHGHPMWLWPTKKQAKHDARGIGERARVRRVFLLEEG